LTLFLAMILDAFLGEPDWLWKRAPHPAVLMGRAVGWLDTRWNHGAHRRAKGVAAVVLLAMGAILLGLIIQAVPTRILDVIVLAILLAQRALIDHVRAVSAALRDSLPAARHAVAQIVGRDTKDMDEPAVARSAIESAAENLSDGVIAPIFWFVVAGLPGVLLYKVINTADSMIGYRTARHAAFGWAAARLDDVLNIVPARLTALMILGVTWRFDVARQVYDDAPAHRSPNAGWPEAAVAYTLNFALSGPRSYDGTLRDYPYVNDRGVRDLRATHIDETIDLMWKVWAMAFFPAFLIALF
jgi:adenosylcobinamide-phosphate synthase